MLGCSVGFGNAVLLVVGLPVRPLEVLAAVDGETTPGAGQKFRSTSIFFGHGTVAADLTIGF